MRLNKNSEKTAIFFSNPFGYGPTGKIIALLDNFSKLWKGNIVCVANGLTSEMHDFKNNKKVIFTRIDERNEKEIIRLLKRLKNPYVVSSLNRFAIKSAIFLNKPSAVIDSLAWFWKKIPEEYLLADFYYCQKIPGVPIRKISKNQKFVPAILGNLPKPLKRKDDFTLIHIGGILNPLIKEIPEYYLKTLACCINNYNSEEKIIVAGGKKAILFLKKHIHRKNIRLGSFPRKKFINYVNSAKHFVTTSGLTATLEAFSLRTPTSFLLPTNLSQWALANNLSHKKYITLKMSWEKYIKKSKLSTSLNEKDAIAIILSYGGQLYSNNSLLRIFMNDFNKILAYPPQIENQLKFINKMGTNGSQIIAEDLISVWS
jgi:hypothetical protein